MSSQYSFMRRNGLSLVLLTLMLIFLVAQFFTGWNEKKKDRAEVRKPAWSVGHYSHS